MVPRIAVGVRSDRIKPAWALPAPTVAPGIDPLDARLEALRTTLHERVPACVDVALLLREGEQLRPLRAHGASQPPGRVGDGVEGAAAALQSVVWDAAVTDRALLRLGARCVAAAPLCVGDEVFGVLRVASAHADAFEGAAVEALRAVADGAALELALLAERRARQRDVRRGDALGRLGRLSLDAPLRELFSHAVLEVSSCLGAPYVTLAEHLGAGAYAPRAVTGWPASSVDEVFETDTARFQATYTLERGASVVSDDLAEESRFDATNIALMTAARSAASVIVPLAGRASYGTLVVHALTPAAFNRDDVVFLERVAVVLGEAVTRAREVAARTDVEARLREAEARHDEALRARDEAIATVAHELRAPTAALSSALGVMRARGALAEVDLDRAQRQVTQLADLVDDLLDAASLAAGRLRMARSPLDLRDIVDPATELAGPWLTARRQRLQHTRPLAPLHTVGDAARLTQVLANLLINASKFSPEGATIALRLEREGGELLLRVLDPGEGIDPALLPRIFLPFAQGARRDGEGTRGVGLGLAIVRTIAALHGGSVEARSDGPGRGSEFVVRLLAAGPDAGGGAPRVLLVDDDDDVRIALQAFLRASGCVVRGVRDGADALREVGAFAPAVVLLDLHLDDMDGREVARRLRVEHPSLPLVAISGYDPDVGGDDGPFCAHLVKPVDLDRLRSLIRELSARAEGPAV
jgi:signal transduction histidine kinase